MTAVVEHECDDPAICPPCQSAAGVTRLLTDQRADPLDDEWSRVFLARYPGVCRLGCGFGIAVGERVRMRDGDVRHQMCVD